MLYIPFREKDESDIMGDFSNYHDRYVSFFKVIQEQKAKFAYWDIDVNKALSDLVENAETVENDANINVAPNLRASDDFDVFEGSRDVTKPIEESFKLQKMPNFDTDEDYYHLVSILNEKQ